MAATRDELRPEDYARVLRLTVEMAAAENAAMRRKLFLTGASDLVHGRYGLLGVIRARRAGFDFDPATMETVGWSDPAMIEKAVASGEFHGNPILAPLLCRLTDVPWAVADRREFFDDDQQHEFPFVRSMLRRLDIGPSLVAVCRMRLARQSLYVSVHRTRASRSGFQPRDVQCMTLLMEVAFRMSHLLARDGALDAELPPRLQETLRGLMAGQSEKEIGCALGISVDTVHHYVTDLLHRFGVHSARELMSTLMTPKKGC